MPINVTVTNSGKIEIPEIIKKCYYLHYTLSEAWSGVNWADLMANSLTNRLVEEFQ